MGVTVKKCHVTVSGNDCWNSVVYFSCCQKADNELADVTLSGAACSRSVLLRPETLDRRWLTV